MAHHTCDRKGPGVRVLDESGERPVAAIIRAARSAGKPQVFAAAGPRYSALHIEPGDWIEYQEPPEKGGTIRHAKVRAMYPFGREPMVDTTLGFVPGGRHP
jgi:hypothetical protein